jgi:hypothetical protein
MRGSNSDGSAIGIEADFSGGDLGADGGLLLLRQGDAHLPLHAEVEMAEAALAGICQASRAKQRPIGEFAVAAKADPMGGV